MSELAPSATTIQAACEALADRDAELARAFADVGAPDWRAAPAAYETLARAIAYQLISTKAAGKIWERVCTHLEDDIRPDRVLSTSEEALRACGLSGPKIKHMKTIADAVQSGELCFERLRQAGIGAARAELLSVPGIGPWTADLFLMNALGHVDAFPHGDVGVMEAHRLLLGVDVRDTAKEFLQRAEAWRPYRGVAAHLLWKWIHQWRDAAPA